MSECNDCNEVENKCCEAPIKEKAKIKPKRDIFRFAGEKPAAINLEHVTQIRVEGKRITFDFYSTAMFVDFQDEEATKTAFEQILTFWSADVLA
jgi:hypothetical protein